MEQSEDNQINKPGVYRNEKGKTITARNTQQADAFVSQGFKFAGRATSEIKEAEIVSEKKEATAKK